VTARIDDTRRLELYGYGLSDSEIAKRVGVSSSTISYWRYSRGLPVTKTRDMSNLSKSEHARRIAFYRRGYCDKALALAFGLTKAGVAGWRRRHGLAINKKDLAQPRLSEADEERRLTLYRRGLSDGAVARDVGVPRTAIFAWRVKRGLLANEQGVKWERPPARFVSLDADLGEGGFNLHGLVPDDAASEWLEDNGATRW
jgi:transposase